MSLGPLGLIGLSPEGSTFLSDPRARLGPMGRKPGRTYSKRDRMIRYLLVLEGRRRIMETTGKDAYRFTAQLTESGLSQLIADDKRALEQDSDATSQ